MLSIIILLFECLDCLLFDIFSCFSSFLRSDFVIKSFKNSEIDEKYFFFEAKSSSFIESKDILFFYKLFFISSFNEFIVEVKKFKNEIVELNWVERLL